MKLLLVLFFVAFTARAQDNNDISHRPAGFPINKDNAVFVDFQEAVYEITYDIEQKSAEVRALMTMKVVEEGLPVFDLVEEPTSVTIDGSRASTFVVLTPSNETTVRVLNRKLGVGLHQLEIKVPLTNLIEFTGSGVKNAFWVTDLEDRYYLERYIPVNFEYDRIKMTFDLHFKGLKSPQHVFANGNITWPAEDRAKVEFPAHFTVNSLYFHTTPVDSVGLVEFNFPSISGKNVPVKIYAQGTDINELPLFQTETIKVLQELEGDYGAFPHESVTIYNADLSSMGLGGMEYAGATVTNLYALGHELFHSYFARGLVPANGNAGWIDEALASWRDSGYLRRNSLSGSSAMASHAPYTRKTDTMAYTFGARFMGLLDGKFADKGGLKPFMNNILARKLFTPIFTEDFIKEMEDFFGEEVTSTFHTYVYGSPVQTKSMRSAHTIHKKMNPSKMRGLL